MSKTRWQFLSHDDVQRVQRSAERCFTIVREDFAFDSHDIPLALAMIESVRNGLFDALGISNVQLRNLRVPDEVPDFREDEAPE